MIATAEMENARACGIAALDEAERDILSARPRAAIAPEGDRLALSRKLRLEFGTDPRSIRGFGRFVLPVRPG